ncbi:hypothetical protein ACFOET_13710 [Parapedobacter deserti]|uniref:Uncharacterized protein n=1 Tax=Parapedobacter deserti TaxID=1912957 RepID=A0ABV7JND7_9SPHI
MKKSFGFSMAVFAVLLLFSACMRNDDEPEFPRRPIARLYVSIEDYQRDASQDPINNVVLIDPADTLDLPIALNYNAGALAGAGIHFNPFLGRLLQAGYSHPGMVDTTIRLMTVGELGTLAASGRVGYRELTAMRGIAYHHPSEMMYVANNATPTAIYGFYRPRNQNGFTRPRKLLQLGADMRPWGMVLWKDSLLVSNATPNNGGVSLYGNFAATDSVETNFPALSTIKIQGATAIRGIAFVDSLDLLVLADFGTNDNEGNPVADGRIYIVEGIKAHLATPSATVVPTRTISGALTGLVGPVDVAIDPRGSADRRTIFVADRDEGKISRFKLSANGNVAPEATVVLDETGNRRRPFGIFLDVRGVAQQ